MLGRNVTVRQTCIDCKTIVSMADFLWSRVICTMFFGFAMTEFYHPMRLADFYDISLVYSSHFLTNTFVVTHELSNLFLKSNRSNPDRRRHINGCVKTVRTETIHTLVDRYERCHSHVTEFREDRISNCMSNFVLLNQLSICGWPQQACGAEASVHPRHEHFQQWQWQHRHARHLKSWPMR
jgi:hypothetical protein